ncbi:MAG: hypothetical protein Q4A07_06860 [Coriobacteriales bacterium]|nr:hypothetical protein [Coriobacteriales bacterium]
MESDTFSVARADYFFSDEDAYDVTVQCKGKLATVEDGAAAGPRGPLGRAPRQATGPAPEPFRCGGARGSSSVQLPCHWREVEF